MGDISGRVVITATARRAAYPVDPHADERLLRSAWLPGHAARASRRGPWRSPACVSAWVLEFEHDSQGRVNLSQFVEAEVGDAFTKTGGVYRSSLFNQHACRLAREGHLGAETRRSR